jgi:hypothetical protein
MHAEQGGLERAGDRILGFAGRAHLANRHLLARPRQPAQYLPRGSLQLSGGPATMAGGGILARSVEWPKDLRSFARYA